MRQRLVVLLLTFIQCAIAQEASLQFEQANQLYRNGEYEQAATMYEQIVMNGYESPALYYNLGNTYFKLKNIPAAILNYERAKRLAPHDDDIAHNLRLANLRVVDKIEPIPQLFFIEWWRLLMGVFSSSGWAVAAIVALWCAAICGVIFRLMRSAVVQRICFVLCLVCILFIVLAFTGTVQQYRHEQNDQLADRKSTRLNSSHSRASRMPSSA